MTRAESPLKARSAGNNTAEPERPANAPQVGAVPLDANGEPLIQITVQASELIGLANYSNVTVGPANITMFVAKGQDKALTDEQAEALASSINQLAQIVEEDVVAHQRGVVLDSIDPSRLRD